MSVQLSPSNSLGFRRPLTQLVKESLTLTNHNVRPVAFKVKTTAPKLYCVRPNSGRVEPGETVEVSVMLQAMKEEPPLNAKCKDKFLIQSTLITQEKEDRPLQEIWNVSETAGADEKVHQQKLKVQYLRAEGQTLEEEEEPPVNPSSMMTVGDSQFDTVRQNPIANGHNAAPIPEFSRSFERETTPPADFSVAREEAHHDHHDDTHDTPSFPAPMHVPPPILQLQRPSEPLYEHERPLAPAPAPAPAPQNDEKIKEAEAEIERLRGLLAAALAAPPPPPTELRKRSRRYSDADTAVSGSDVGTYVGEPVSPEGVPLQVVVIIALGVFITTYLFF